MELNEYQAEALSTAIYPNDNKVEYLALALCGEAGEVADKVKKVIRDHNGDFSDKDTRDRIAYELGDVLWYAANLARAIGYSLSEVATLNLAKIDARKLRGTIHGTGDNR